MTLADLLGVTIRFRVALALALIVALLAVLIITPRAIRKLQGAGIHGKDRHKPGEPSVPEMGGLAVFIAFNMGAFTILGFGNFPREIESLLLASLVVIAGACITGALDDLIVLRQRFKAFIPFAFATPLALYVEDSVIAFPQLGGIDFGLWYPLLLVPLGIAAASNGFNMLEGFNGLGAGLGIIIAATLAGMALSSNQLTGLALLMPLVGALGGFLWYNAYPSRVFPGDTMTLMVGATIAAAAILSKLEFWGALLLVPHIVEFFLKARARFEAECFASHMDGRYMWHEGHIHSLTHILLKFRRFTEPQLVATMWILMAVYSLGVLLAFHFVQA